MILCFCHCFLSPFHAVAHWDMFGLIMHCPAWPFLQPSFSRGLIEATSFHVLLLGFRGIAMAATQPLLRDAKREWVSLFSPSLSPVLGSVLLDPVLPLTHTRPWCQGFKPPRTAQQFPTGHFGRTWLARTCFHGDAIGWKGPGLCH